MNIADTACIEAVNVLVDGSGKKVVIYEHRPMRRILSELIPSLRGFLQHLLKRFGRAVMFHKLRFPFREPAQRGGRLAFDLLDGSGELFAV